MQKGCLFKEDCHIDNLVYTHSKYCKYLIEEINSLFRLDEGKIEKTIKETVLTAYEITTNRDRNVHFLSGSYAPSKLAEAICQADIWAEA